MSGRELGGGAVSPVDAASSVEEWQSGPGDLFVTSYL